MALRMNILFLIAAFILFLFLSAARPQAMAKSVSEDDNGIEVIKNVKKNKEVQDLGRFALKQINNKKASNSIGGKVSYSEPLGFCGVAKAKRWHGLDGWNYHLVIKSEKMVQKIKGRLNVYVYTSSYGNVKTVKAGIFKPEKKKIHF